MKFAVRFSAVENTGTAFNIVNSLTMVEASSKDEAVGKG